MAKKTWANLHTVEVVSGTAQDSPTDYRGFVTVRAIAEDGSIMSGQIDPTTLRTMAMQFLETAEASEQDAIVFTLMTSKLGLPPQAAAAFVSDMRDERARQQDKPDAG